VLLAQGQTPKVSAAVVYHGSLLTPADVEAVTAPINFQQSDPALDKNFGPELYKQVCCDAVGCGMQGLNLVPYTSCALLLMGCSVVAEAWHGHDQRLLAAFLTARGFFACLRKQYGTAGRVCCWVGWLLCHVCLYWAPFSASQVESILSKKASSGLDASITSYPKQAHGFSLRGDTGDATVAAAANTAFGAGKAFLDKHLK
jgi:hypothetical protein